MLMWPTASTPVLLTMGLSAFLLAFVPVMRNGIQEATRFRFISVLLMWLGYHLSPWLMYLSGSESADSLLVQDYIDRGLLMSSLAMFSILLGYDFYRPQRSSEHSSEVTWKQSLRRISQLQVLLLTLASFAAFLILVGGPLEAWDSQLPRGYGQFEERDGLGKIKQMAVVLSVLLHLAAGGAAVLYMIHERARPRKKIFGAVCAITSSFHWAWSFSRVAGVILGFYAFIVVKLYGKRKLLTACIALMLAIYFGLVGFLGRDANPGIKNYLIAVIKPHLLLNTIETGQMPLPDQNFLNFMGAWTRKAEQREADEPSLLPSMLTFVWNLQPLPSEIAGLRPLGQNLSEVMGTVGSNTAITTPALAEVYYLFGFGGAVVYVCIGWMFAWLDWVSRRSHILLGVTLTFCGISAAAVGLHSGIRAMTRPFVYAFALIITARIVRSGVLPRSRVSRDFGRGQNQ